MARRIYPVPETLGLSGIDIRDGGGSMDNMNRIMRVPLTDDPGARHIRAHEMSHAKYSPAKPLAPAGLPAVAIQRAEDMRMNVYGRRQGLHEALDAPTFRDTAQLLDIVAKSRTDAITAMASAYNTGDYDAVKAAASLPLGEDLERAEEYVRDLWARMDSLPEPSWDDAVSTAKSLAAFDESDPASEPDNGMGDGEPSDGEPSDGEPSEPMSPVDLSSDPLDELADREQIEKAEREAKKNIDPVEAGIEGIGVYVSHKTGGKIVQLKITEQKLTKRLAPSKLRSRSAVPMDSGRVPRYMHRYGSDRAVFAGRGKRRDNGGAVLIDCSGSMRIGFEDIDTIMESAPAGTIATYNGIDMTGELYVIARNGKRAERNLKPPHGGNVADVPALEWLAKQDGPRFWVCDGIVTGGTNHGGYHEIASQNIVDRCKELCLKHRIIRVHWLDNLADAMRRQYNSKGR